MQGGSQQSPSYSTGNSGNGWQQPFSSASSSQNSNPFFNMSTPQMPSYQPQAQQQNWSSLSPSYNSFSQLAAQGTPTPLTNQQGVDAAMQQQTVLTSAQPTVPPVAVSSAAPTVPQTNPTIAATQNFSLADANQTAGLPATGMPQPVTPAPVAPPVAAAPPAPVASKYFNTLDDYLAAGKPQGGIYGNGVTSGRGANGNFNASDYNIVQTPTGPQYYKKTA